MLIDLIAGARPNFVKLAPLVRALEECREAGVPLRYRLIHTGQHSTELMSDAFFRQLQLPAPDICLRAQGNTHATFTASVMTAYEQVLQQHRPDWTLVVGDVNSTLACALAAKKTGNVSLAHVEAGIRSHDRSMPEEINRILTDTVSDLLFAPTEAAARHLLDSGIPAERVHFTGNIMIDTLLAFKDKVLRPGIWEQHDLGSDKGYLLLTLHRPSNVDDPAVLDKILNNVAAGAGKVPVVFPVHPRTRQVLRSLPGLPGAIVPVEPLGYLEFQYLVQHARGVVTDSGGLPEETTVLGIPCLVVREHTERPETCSIGTAELVGQDGEKTIDCIKNILLGRWKKGGIPPLWDGQTGKRIARIFNELVAERN